MFEDKSSIQHRLSQIFGSVIAAACLSLLTLLIWNAATAPRTSASINASEYSPNVVATGMSTATNELGMAFDKTTGQVDGAIKTTGMTIANSGASVGNFGKAVGDGVLAGTGTIFRGIGSGFAFVFRVPGNIIGSIGNSHAVSTLIRPGEHDHDHENTPVIDPDSPELKAAVAALANPVPATPGAQPAPSSIVQWPVHGAVTTEYGATGWPYKTYHTGIDISDGTRPGTTPVRPFRQGTVTATVTGYSGLGIYVTVDHGNGVTSVYAHLASIAVKTGQVVDTNTVLGMQGTTGLSTGTHLHFEIRVNGQAANPREFISGNP